MTSSSDLNIYHAQRLIYFDGNGVFNLFSSIIIPY